MAVIDSFTDTDGTLLTAHAAEIGEAWTKITLSGAYTGTIQSNKAQHLQSASTGTGLHAMGIGQSDVTLRATVEADHGDAVMDLMARYANLGDFWTASAYIGGNSLRIIQRSGGVVTLRASVAVALAINTPYQLEFSAIGNVLTATINGASCTYTSSALASATSIGIGCTNSAANRKVLFDNLELVSSRRHRQQPQAIGVGVI